MLWIATANLFTKPCKLALPKSSRTLSQNSNPSAPASPLSNPNNMTTEQALQNLYAAARQAPLKADDHELVRKCAEQLAEALKPKETKVE